MAKQQPGVMLYFEVRQCLKRLTLEEKGALFEAILDYGEHGIVPAFDGVLGVAWDFVCLRIDKDSQRYEDVSRRRAAAARARWEKEQGMQMHANDANADFAMQTMPTTTTTSTTTSTSTPTPAAQPGKGPREAAEVGGKRQRSVKRCTGPPGGGDDLGGIRASMAWMDSFLAEQLGASPGEERPPDTRAPPE